MTINFHSSATICGKEVAAGYLDDSIVDPDSPESGPAEQRATISWYSLPRVWEGQEICCELAFLALDFLQGNSVLIITLPGLFFAKLEHFLGEIIFCRQLLAQR